MAWPDFDYDLYENFEDGVLESGLTETDTAGILTLSSTDQYKIGTHSMKIDHTGITTEAYINMGSVNLAAVSFGFWYRSGSNFANSGDHHNIIRASDGATWGRGLLEGRSNIDGHHVLFNNNSSEEYEIEDYTWYYITVKFDPANSLMSWRVYSESYELVWSSTQSTGGTGNIAIWFLGTFDGSSINSAIYYDSFIMDSTDATFPLLGWESGGGPLVGASALVGGGILCGQGNLIN